MIKRSLLIAVLMGLGINLVWAAAPGTQPNKIMALVGADLITQQEVLRQTAWLNKGATKVTERQALENLIELALQREYARLHNITISGLEVEEALAKIAQNNKLTVAELLEAVQTREGLNAKRFRAHLYEQLLLSKTQQLALGKRLTVNETEVTNLLRHPPQELQESLNGAQLTPEQARNFALQQKLARLIPAWLKELRNTSYVKIY